MRGAGRVAFAKLAAFFSTHNGPPDKGFSTALTQSFQYGINENLKSWNKRFSRQVFSLATRSRFRANAREKTCIKTLLSMNTSSLFCHSLFEQDFCACCRRIQYVCFFAS
jgi:hypothetical protein